MILQPLMKIISLTDVKGMLEDVSEANFMSEVKRNPLHLRYIFCACGFIRIAQEKKSHPLSTVIYAPSLVEFRYCSFIICNAGSIDVQEAPISASRSVSSDVFCTRFAF